MVEFDFDAARLKGSTYEIELCPLASDPYENEALVRFRCGSVSGVIKVDYLNNDEFAANLTKAFKASAGTAELVGHPSLAIGIKVEDADSATVQFAIGPNDADPDTAQVSFSGGVDRFALQEFLSQLADFNRSAAFKQ